MQYCSAECWVTRVALTQPTLADDDKKYDRFEILSKKLKDVQAEHMKIYENYYRGIANAEDVIQVKEKLDQIQEEWRSTLVTLKKK